MEWGHGNWDKLVSSARSAVFLDKDGTLLDDVPYNVRPERMRFAPGAREALTILAALDDVLLIVVSNQAGVAHGRFHERALEPVSAALGNMFRQCGARMHAFYYCPHHPDGTLRRY